ncbi:hypothetical protein GS429_10690 [Natronorubrum sp. JWXQ-INN-674]|uniref:Lipoprotein n=1 Tax=Natronorubrum halalkaliphilum TaxID=2691917 RepID=A0A6B0VLR4_9EURY|nr:DUF6517 family protein [Natronorubrum halalkaliphilum]MXV62520.1 hypothetical protein [Natronorubrum halalkaliphilum]
MTLSRRTLLAAGATGTLALTAGCLDFVRGNGPLELQSERAAPTDAALEDAGYETHEIEEESIDETVEVGVERDVHASIWTSIYSKEVEYRGYEHEGSFFAAVSVPDVSVLGYSVNPIADMSNEDLLEEFIGQLDGDHGSIENITHQESFSLEILGDGRDVDVFEGETDLEGESIDVEIALTSFAHEDDIIVLLGSYPAALAEESANAEVLMESVEHPV